MNKIFSRLILWFTALSAVFFTSPVFALTASDGTVYTIGHTNNSRVFNWSGQAIYCASANFSFSQFNSWSLCTSNVNASNDFGAWPLRSYDSYYTQRYVLNGSTYKFHLNCNVSSWSWLYYTFLTDIKVWVDPTINMYGSYLKIHFQNKNDNLFYDRFYRASDCAVITEAQALALPAYTPPWSCTTDTIASGGNCSCKKTGGYSATASWSTPLVWKYNWLNVSASITTANTTDAFSSKFKNYYIKLPSGVSYKPDIILGTIDASWIGGARSVQAIWSSTWMIYSDSRTLVSTASANEYTFYTSDGWMLSSTPIVWNVTTNSATNDDNTFNSFVINSSSGGFLPIAYNRFSVYYQKGAGWSYSNLADNYTYLGDYLANKMITLPYGEKTRRVKIVPLSTTVYVSWVSPFNTPFTEDQLCTVLDGSALTAELDSRSSLSWSLAIASTNFCWVALDVPVVGSALGAMCNFVQPYAKSFVAKWQPVVDIINIVPPATAPTTFDYYPKFTFSGMTMDISTQSGAIPVYSSWSDVNPLKITSDEASSNMKIWVLALISILLYLVVYALHFWIVAGLVWLLLHISRFFTGFAWKHNSSGNVWALIPFLAYAWIFFTAILSIVGSISFILPLLLVLRAYALFLIVWLTSFAPWSYALFSGFFTVMFSSIFLIGIFYLVHFLIERFWKLN